MKKINEITSGSVPLFAEDIVQTLQNQQFAINEGVLRDFTNARNTGVIVSGIVINFVTATQISVTYDRPLVYINYEFMTADLSGTVIYDAPNIYFKGSPQIIEQRLNRANQQVNFAITRLFEVVVTNDPPLDPNIIGITQFGTNSTLSNVYRRLAHPIGSIDIKRDTSSFVGVTGIGEYWGWRICDGGAGTPNLNGRVAVGLDRTNEFGSNFDIVGKIGGFVSHLLTAAQTGLRQHRHRILRSNENGEFPTTIGSIERAGLSPSTAQRYVIEGGGERELKVGDVQNIPSLGDSALEPHNNLQPYATVVYIMRVN